MVGAASTPLPTDPATQFAEWKKHTEYRMKNLEGHSGGAMPRGVLQKIRLTTNTGNLSDGAVVSDMNLLGEDDAGLWVDESRQYEVRAHFQVQASAISLWTFECEQVTVDDTGVVSGSAVPVDRYGLIHTFGAGVFGTIDGTVLWEPPTGRFGLRLTVELASGSGTVNITASEPPSAAVRREIILSDMGGRI